MISVLNSIDLIVIETDGVRFSRMYLNNSYSDCTLFETNDSLIGKQIQ